ncbi:hypothetical protein KKH65_01165 [bacterium]|nr:hypothetical protein [bacterium]
MAKVDDYLKELLDKRGSDLHIRAGEPPILRMLIKAQSGTLSGDDTTCNIYTGLRHGQD